MIKKMIYSCIFACTLLSCSNSEEGILPIEHNLITRSLNFGFGGGVLDWESAADGRVLNGYVVVNNKLIARELNLQPDATNRLDLETPEGSLVYFTLGSAEPLSLQKLVAGTASEADLLAALVDGYDNESYFLTTEAVAESGSVDLIRSVGRLDLALSEDGATQISRIEFEDLAQNSLLFKGSTTAPITRYKDAREFSPALLGSTTAVRYLYETQKPVKVTVYGNYNNLPITVSAEIPSISRNKIYSLRVNNNGASLSLSLSIRDWELGEIVESAPDVNHPLKIDSRYSVFPANVTPDYNANSVFVGAAGATFKLAFLSDSKVDVISDAESPSTILIGSPEVSFTDKKVCTLIPITVPAQSLGDKPYELTLAVKNVLSDSLITDSVKINVEGNVDKFYSVAYDANGGLGSMKLQTVKYNEKNNFVVNVFTHTGYIFSGWNTKADGTGAGYSNNAEFMNLTEVENDTVTLYAQWNAINYSIQFVGNGGVGSMSDISMRYDEAKSLAQNIFTRDEYRFLNWNTDVAGAGVIYEDKSTVTNLTSVSNGVIKLYAQWELIAQDKPTTIVYVTALGAGTGTGSSWENAMPGAQLQLALDMGIAEVRLAQGVYTSETGGGTSTFVISKGVSLSGGWNPLTGERSMANKSVLQAADGKRVVMIGADNVLLDNVVVTGGYPAQGENGGGLLIDGTNVVVRNSIVIANRTFSLSGGDGHGAGINISALSRNILINNSVIAHNEILNSVGRSAGVNVMAATSTNSTTLNFCTIVNNKISASTNFGIGTTNANLNSCVLWNNTSNASSASVYETYSGNLAYCAFNQGIFTSNKGQVKILNDNVQVVFTNPSTTSGYITNWSSYDYNIESNSILAASGTSVAGITSDIIGTERPADNPSIGAYQYR